MTVILYIDFFQQYKLIEGGVIDEAYTTQLFPSYIGVNVPVEYVAGSLGTKDGQTKIVIPRK